MNDEKKIIGEEYVAYTNSATSQFSPLIAVCKYDGTTTIRDMVREDISRINDDNPVRGGMTHSLITLLIHLLTYLLVN